MNLRCMRTKLVLAAAALLSVALVAVACGADPTATPNVRPCNAGSGNVSSGDSGPSNSSTGDGGSRDSNAGS